MAKEMSPSLQAAFQSFQQRFPQFDLATGFSSFGPAMRNTQDPVAFSEFLNLRRMMDAEDYNFNASGQPQHDDPVWKQALQVGAGFALPVGLYGAAGGFSGGAAGASGPAASGSAAANAIPTTVGLTGAAGTGMSAIIRRLAEAGIPLGTALGTRALTGGGNNSGSGQTSPEMQDLMEIALKRIRDQQPLQDSVNRQAHMGLPTYAREGSQ